VTLKSPKGDELSYVLQIHFPTTNNIVEYEALLHGLHVVKEIGVKQIMCCGDSNCDDLKFDNKFEVPVMYSTAIPETLLRYT
jgi:hypothetical protein